MKLKTIPISSIVLIPIKLRTGWQSLAHLRKLLRRYDYLEQTILKFKIAPEFEFHFQLKTGTGNILTASGGELEFIPNDDILNDLEIYLCAIPTLDDCLYCDMIDLEVHYKKEMRIIQHPNFGMWGHWVKKL
jgi:hypothetical protein